MWFLDIVFTVVVLLNFLIAQVTEVFEKVKASGTIFLYKEKAGMNLKALQLKGLLNMNEGFQFIVFSSAKEVAEGAAEDETFGFTNQVKKDVTFLLNRVKNSLQK